MTSRLLARVRSVGPAPPVRRPTKTDQTDPPDSPRASPGRPDQDHALRQRAGRSGSVPPMGKRRNRMNRMQPGRDRKRRAGTLAGMFTPLPDKPDPNSLELAILDFWSQEDIFT